MDGTRRRLVRRSPAGGVAGLVFAADTPVVCDRAAVLTLLHVGYRSPYQLSVRAKKAFVVPAGDAVLACDTPRARFFVPLAAQERYPRDPPAATAI